jgi:uncharacterized membrane protein
MSIPDDRHAIEAALHNLAPLRDPVDELVIRRTFGERAADSIAKFGGSWTFILTFSVLMLIWAFLNTEILGPRHDAFDPYPFVFLNLILSTLAALQAPVIMMSQNRQATRDRLEADIDHEVNVRADLNIQSVEAKMAVLEQQLAEVLRQLDRLHRSPP